MRSIDDYEKTGRALRTGYTTKCYINSDAFIYGVAIKAVNSGQINQVECAMCKLHSTLVFFNCYARKICGCLTQTGQTVEQGTFSGVRISDERY